MYLNGRKILTVNKTEPSTGITLNVTPSTSSQTITPPTNKTFDEVNVEAVTSSIDANIQASNIVSGITILGVEGTAQSGGGDITDAILDRTISAYIGSASYIGSYVFAQCSNLSYAINETCSLISNSAFISCTNLSYLSFPACEYINANAFSNCTALSTVNFPECLSIGNYGFYLDKNLTEVSFPKCTYIGENAFSGCSKLLSAEFSKCTTVRYAAFYGCYSLSTIKLPVCMSFMGSSIFASCRTLVSLYITDVSSVPSINRSNIFVGTPIAGYTTYTSGVYGSIYVPASLYESFKTATY